MVDTDVAKVEFEARSLPQDHPAWKDDRSGIIAVRWWDVTVTMRDGSVFRGTADWNVRDFRQVIRSATHQRPSEVVLQQMDRQRRQRLADDNNE